MFRRPICVLQALLLVVVGAFVSSNAFAATPAAGFNVIDWMTSAANTGWFGVGPVGIAADPNSVHDIYVMNYVTGQLYKYNDAVGGVESSTAPIGAVRDTSVHGYGWVGNYNAAGLAFDKDGRLYVALQGWWRVAEIDKMDGRILRYLGSPITSHGDGTGMFYCATGIATDPISGDIFVSSPCGWGTVYVHPDGTGGGAVGPAVDGITFGPDGTLWGAGGNQVWKIDGTNKPTFGSYASVAYVPGGDGISVAAASDDPALPPYIFVNRTDGIITKVDLSGSSPVYTDIVTGGTRGDFSTVGYDGCLYATQTDSVIKVTNADGTCSLAPVTPDDATSLVIAAPSSQDYRDTVAVSATLTNVSKSTVLSGQTVVFMLGSTTCTGVTDASGVASCTMTIADPAGPATLTAHFDHQPKLAPATTTAPFTITKEETTLSYTGISGGIQNGSTVVLSGVLQEDGVMPLAGEVVAFTLGSQSCNGVTNAAGAAACSIVVAQASGAAAITASFGGSAYYQTALAAASATISAASALVYTGATTGDYNDPATLSATLTSALTGQPIAGASVALGLGAQSCAAVTTATGAASCAITPSVAAGIYPVTAAFAGNSAFDPSSASASFTVTKEQTTIAVSFAPAKPKVKKPVTLTGVLKEDGVTPIAGRTITLTIGSQSCTAVTDAAGSASCTIASLAKVLHDDDRPVTVTATFAGDTYYLGATATVATRVAEADDDDRERDRQGDSRGDHRDDGKGASKGKGSEKGDKKSGTKS